jgi:hypothetical protein
MPRSGTKLMRALLNQHPSISITMAESHFIPYFVKKFGNPPAFYGKEDLDKFVKLFLQTSFYHTMNKLGFTLKKHDFVNSVIPDSWSSIFEYIFRHFSPKHEKNDVIWGDKTPGYVNHIILLKDLFPKAKFIHMLRDPRDYCLSVRKSWHKSAYRAAYRWRETIKMVQKDRVVLSEQDYIEVHYEDLLSDTKNTMYTVSDFLGCPYHPHTVKLEKSPEDVGDTKGKYGIVADNMNKYIHYFPVSKIKRIEEVVYDVATSLNYAPIYATKYEPLNILSLKYLKIYDGMASLKYHTMKADGLYKGMKRFINHYTKSSWR